MKTLLALLAFAAPAAAFATSPVPADTFGSLTGTVKITTVYCIRAPCPPMVSVEGANGVSVAITGALLRDVESLRGKEITVKGLVSGHTMNVTAVAPGRSHNFVTGTVRNTTVCDRMIPATCRYSVDLEQLDGSVIKVTDEKMAKGLSTLDGALVSVKGNVTNTPCPPGQMCIQLYQPTLWPDHRANIWVRGNLSHAYHTMEVTYPPTEKAKYFLGFPNGGAAAVFTGKNYQNLVERDAWFSGSFDGDKLRVTKSGYAVVPDPAISIFPWSGGVVDGGSNVPLDSDTNGGAAVVAATGSVGAAQGAGILRD